MVWSLQISSDGTVLQLLGYSDSGPVQVLAAPIAWPAHQYHCVALDYGPQGTALFIDGQMAAQGGGTLAIPLSVGALVLGSSIAGTETAHGAFDEFFSFNAPLTPAAVAFYYQATGAESALGPLPAAASGLVGGAQPQMLPARVYDPNHDMNCSPGGPVYITNVFATLQGNATTTFYFDIQGGTNGVFHDIFGTENVTNNVAEAQWSWIGQGLTCNTYSFTNQPADQSYYQLKVPVETMTVCWGATNDGQCNVPFGLSNAMAVAGGQDFSLAMRGDGTVIGWGDNTYDQTEHSGGIDQCHRHRGGAVSRPCAAGQWRSDQLGFLLGTESIIIP